MLGLSDNLTQTVKQFKYISSSITFTETTSTYAWGKHGLLLIG